MRARSLLRSAARLAPALALVGSAALVLLPAAAARADVTVRSLTQDLTVDDAVQVGFHSQVGELDAEATDGDSVRVEVAIQCEKTDDERCRKIADSISLKIRRSGSRLGVDVSDWPKLRDRGLSVKAHLMIPRKLGLEVDMGVGEISIRGLEGDVEVDVGVGEISVVAPQKAFRSVSMDTGVGKADLVVGGHTIEGHGMVGGNLKWKDGPGPSHIELDSGVGDLRVELQ
jgi:hypothetical protein